MTSDLQPIVTIFALCHEHKNFLWAALESIRTQSYQSIELIILDNASEDGSQDLIREWISATEVKCTYIINPEKYTVTKNCNIGLGIATGKYFQGIACDDILMPEKIAHQVSMFENSREGIACIYGDIVKIDETGRIISKETEFTRLKRILNVDVMPTGHLKNELSERPFIHAPSVLCRTACLRAVGGYNEKLVYEDWAMWVDLSKNGYEFAPLNEITVHYRILSNSLDRQRTIQFYKSTIFILSHNRKYLNMKLKGARNQWLFSIREICKISFLSGIREYLIFMIQMKRLGLKYFITQIRVK